MQSKSTHSSTGPLAGQTDASTLNLSMVGNCAISALIDQRANIVWCCMPRFDSNPAFHALLSDSPAGKESASFRIELENQTRVEQRYVAGTAVVKTTLFDDINQSVEITDFAPRFTDHGRIFRPAQLVRRIRPLSGNPRIKIVIQPAGSWGSGGATITRGTSHLR
ncbi:MAG: trehalase-like domain-containing protein, partial [Burkholderiaceae bacterium]